MSLQKLSIQRYLIPVVGIGLMFASCHQVELSETQSENSVTDCRDSIDNDDDGDVDCADDDCAEMAFCVASDDSDAPPQDGLGAGDDEDTENAADGEDESGNESADNGAQDSDTVAEVALSVDEDTPMEELSDDEQWDVCSDAYDAIAPGLIELEKDLNSYTCTSVGVSAAAETVAQGGNDAEMIAVCEEAVKACDEIDDSLYAGTLSEDAFCSDADTNFDNCAVPAGEVLNCIVALFRVQIATVNEYLEQMPDCNGLTIEFYDGIDEMSANFDQIEPPASCAVVETQCPEVMARLN